MVMNIDRPRLRLARRSLRERSTKRHRSAGAGYEQSLQEIPSGSIVT